MIAKIIPFTRLPYFIISRDQKKETFFFDYLIPKELEEKIKFGQLVKIYFRNKKISGLVIGLKKTTKEKKLKPIEKIIFEESLITKNQLKILKWLSSFYLASLPTILKTSIPQPTKKLAIYHDRDIWQVKSILDNLRISKSFIPTLRKMINLFSQTKRKKFLLLWQDPSEKLAFYYAVIKKTLRENQKVLILVPEIEQIQFLIKYFSKLSDKILVFHSGLKKSEIWRNWQKILNNEAEIIIGTRMVIFSPLENLGLIILENEESDLYCSKQFPYYDVRIIAWKMTKLNKAKLFFSSVAPRVETYYYTFNQAKFLPLDLRKTGEGKNKLVDMQEEIKKGNFLPISDNLKENIIKVVQAGKKVLLFLKRKGFATFNFCADCGIVFLCPRCKISLVSHQKNKSHFFLCHHCGFKDEIPIYCPRCQSVKIKMKGIAIQKVEEILKEIFKNYKIKRIEANTKSKSKEGEVILTTLPFYQDWSKKWSENLGLVGIINADILLNQPDFRVFEKTFQELKAISDWTNYFKIPLLVQSWSTDNSAIKNALDSQSDNFYRNDLETRRNFLYPPFVRLFNLVLQDKNKKWLQKKSRHFQKEAKKIQNKNISILPLPALPRRKKIFETHFLIKIKNLHPLSPLPAEIKKILPANSYLNPN